VETPNSRHKTPRWAEVVIPIELDQSQLVADPGKAEPENPENALTESGDGGKAGISGQLQRWPSPGNRREGSGKELMRGGRSRTIAEGALGFDCVSGRPFDFDH
jgi:hypothetical protein